MSFPPRPPMMPPMGNIPPPSMMSYPPPFGAPPPIGMPPMGMLRPPMIPPIAGNFVPNQIKPIPIPEKAPSTTVFIGNISEKAPDLMIRQMLQRCGNVLSWKRAQGANGKLQGFGFCEYEDPEATLRCFRLLNGYEIVEKKLVVKVDQKTRELLADHLKKTRGNNDKQSTNAKKAAMMRNKSDGSETDQEINLELVDEDTLREDRFIIQAFELILKQHAKDMTASEAPPPPSETVATPSATTSTTTTTVLIKDSTTNNLINEVNKEPLSKDEDKTPPTTIRKETLEQKERESSRRRSITPERSVIRNQSSNSYQNSSPTHNNNRSPTQRRRSRERRGSSSEMKSRSDSRNQNHQDHKENRERPQVSHEETEEMRERRRLERKLREKEMAYRDRLRDWEQREEKRQKEYEIEKKKEMQRRRALQKDAKKLKQFLEDYDDEKDDAVHYKSSNLEKKLKQREKEIEMDNRDRQREREELDELRKKLLEKGHHLDAEIEAQRIQNEENMRMKLKFDKYEESSSSEEESESDGESKAIANLNSENKQTKEEDPKQVQVQQVGSEKPSNESTNPIFFNHESNSSAQEAMDLDDEASTNKNETLYESQKSNSLLETPNDTPTTNTNNADSEKASNYDSSSPGSASPIFAGMQFGSSQSLTLKPLNKKQSQSKSIQPVNQAFAEEEEDQTNGTKRLKLSEIESERKSAEERKKAVKVLVESIPTGKQELFDFPVDWNQLDQNLMEKRIKPWINKKIIEYIGEEEASLHDFICSKIQQHAKPDRLLEEIKVILDEEAELFVIKMWRLIVYETESKRLGLTK